MSGLQFKINNEDLAVLQKVSTRIVVVVGLAASGKTTVANALHESYLDMHSYYHSDDYIDHGYEQSLYAMIKDLEADDNPYKLIEGIQGFRFLRKMAETRQFNVDAIIFVTCDSKTRAARYLGRGKGNLPESFDRNLQTVYSSFIEKMDKSRQPMPRIITVMT